MVWSHSGCSLGGETFTFKGDDDVWVFINDQLVIDLGGVYPADTGNVDLDAEATRLGIQRGKRQRMDIFQAERHTEPLDVPHRDVLALHQERDRGEVRARVTRTPL